MPADIDQSLFE